MTTEDHPVQDRRREDRRKLFGKPFLAMLAGALPEDRRKSERRKSVDSVRGEDDATR